MRSTATVRTAAPSGSPPSWAARLSAWTDALSRRLRPTVMLAGRRWPAYGTFVCGGVAGGLLLTSVLGGHLGLSAVRMAFAATVGLTAALLLAYGSRAATGSERYVFFHYQFASLTAAGVALALWPGPVLAHLDLLALTLGIGDASGRVGCLNTGCCHGRPVRWGIRYSPRHVDAGFSPDLVGVRLWPVQPLETIAVGAVVAGGTALLLAGAPPGTALTVYLLGYSACRFLLEMLRGDADRLHRGGLSEGQWTSLATVVGTSAASAAGWLPGGRGDLAVGVTLATTLGLAALYTWRHHRLSDGLIDNRHATEVAGQLRQLTDQGCRNDGGVAVGTTDLGLRLSVGALPHGHHVSLSRIGRRLGQRQATAIARMILQLGSQASQADLVRGEGGVWHLVVPEQRTWRTPPQQPVQ